VSRFLYLPVCCPHENCGKSLLTDEFIINNKPSVHLIAEKEHKKGDIYLSAFYDDFEAIEPPELNILPGDIIKFYCPHCGKELPFKEKCCCGAPMVSLAHEDGLKIRICTRKGCQYHSLEFEHSSDFISLIQKITGYRPDNDATSVQSTH